jgi:hypothetical protein
MEKPLTLEFEQKYLLEKHSLRVSLFELDCYHKITLKDGSMIDNQRSYGPGALTPPWATAKTTAPVSQDKFSVGAKKMSPARIAELDRAFKLSK